ncbi:hypothetical protein ACYOEI_24000, partial [Singulisphaera rosea]
GSARASQSAGASGRRVEWAARSDMVLGSLRQGGGSVEEIAWSHLLRALVYTVPRSRSMVYPQGANGRKLCLSTRLG